MDHRSIRDQLVFAIGYVASRSKGLQRDILKCPSASATLYKSSLSRWKQGLDSP